MKQEVVFVTEENGKINLLQTMQRLHVPHFKCLRHLVRPTDSFEINREYIAKSAKKIPKK